MDSRSSDYNQASLPNSSADEIKDFDPLFGDDPNPENNSDDDEMENRPANRSKQLNLTESNLTVHSRQLSASGTFSKSPVDNLEGLQGLSYILDDRMMKVVDFMLNPDFDKVGRHLSLDKPLVRVISLPIDSMVIIDDGYYLYVYNYLNVYDYFID